MRSFLGFHCLRTSPSLAGAVRSQAHTSSARSARLTLDLLPSQGRCLSVWPSSSTRLSTSVPEHFSQSLRRSPPTLINHQRRTLFGSRSPPVITNYVHLPPDYHDATGLPFRKGEGLTQDETWRIFPHMKITPALATELLKIMHGRRVAGTLDDPSFRKHTATFSQQEIDRALKYLRSEVPVDEIMNAGLRAEDELRELERVMTGKVSEEAPVTEAEEEVTSAKKDAKPSDIYGESILDRIRAANVARREAEERAEAEQRKKEEEAAAQNWGGLTAYDPSLHRGLHPKQLEHYEAATSDLEEPPMTARRWHTLLPTTILVAALLGGLYLTVAYVAPPRPGSDLETKLTIGAIVAINVSVFIAWRRVRLWKYLNRHFILDLVTPRPYQAITAIFSHQGLDHIFKTLLVGISGGLLLIPEIGPVPFVATYVASGACGFLGSMYSHVARAKLVHMLGASSASFGVVCAYFWLYRFDGFKILGLPPDPASGLQGLGIIGLLMAFFALGPMVRRQGGGVDWTSHLVGMLTGICCSSIMETRWKTDKGSRAESEARKPIEPPTKVEKK